MTGPTDWTGGTIAGGGTITTLGALTMGDPSANDDEYLSGASLDNRAAATLADQNGNNGLQLRNGAVFDNEPGASFTLLTAAPISGDGSGTVFRNDGTLVQAAGVAGESGVSAIFDQSATGTAEIMGGGIYFAAGGTITSTLTADAGTYIDLDNGTFDLDAASTLAGAGDLYVTYATVNESGAYGIAGTTYLRNGTLDFEGGAPVSIPTLAMSGGALTGFASLTVTGPTDWTGGTIAGGGTITTLGALTMGDPSANDDEYLSGASLDNRAAATLADQNGNNGLQLRNGAVFDNEPGAASPC